MPRNAGAGAGAGAGAPAASRRDSKRKRDDTNSEDEAYLKFMNNHNTKPFNDALGGHSLSGSEHSVLISASEHVIITVRRNGDVFSKTDIFAPHMTKGSIGYKSAERRALDAFKPIIPSLRKGDMVRITSTCAPWADIWDNDIWSLLHLDLAPKGVNLQVLSCRESDAPQVTCGAHKRLWDGGDNSGLKPQELNKARRLLRVVSLEVREGQLHFGVPTVLVDKNGCHLARISAERNPESFGNATGLKGLAERVQAAAKGDGEGSNILRDPCKLVLENLESVTKNFPEVVAMFEGTASAETRRAFFGGMGLWEDTVTSELPGGANYLLSFFAGGARITVRQLFDELTGPREASYNVLGMDSDISTLKKHIDLGHGAWLVDVVNSGEATLRIRPFQHVLDTKKGNPLPRALARAFNAIEPGCVTSKCIFAPWTSEGSGLTAREALETRMSLEALFNILLHTQEGPASRASVKFTGKLAAVGIVSLGSNFISGGWSVGNPLKMVRALGSGSSGHLTLAAHLAADLAYNIIPVDFFADRLGRAHGYTRDHVLSMTAKAALAEYNAVVGM
jgi:hypothetical protein